MRFLVAVVALAPFAALVVAMLRGRVVARCCAVPPEQDARLAEPARPMVSERPAAHR